MSSPVGVDEGTWLAQQFVGVGTEVVTLSLNEVGREGLQPLKEERRGGTWWWEVALGVRMKRGRHVKVGGEEAGDIRRGNDG